MYVLMCRFAALDGVNLSLKLWSNLIKSSRNHAEVALKMMSIWVHHIQLTIGDSSSGIFSSNFLSIRLDSWQCMRDSSIPSKYLCSWLYLCAYRLAFWRELLRSIVNLHFCLPDKADIASSWCDLSVGLLSIRQKWKLRSLDRGFGDFRRCTKMWWFMGPAGSHTSAPLELWAYLKCFHVLVMKIKLSPHKFRASMPF